ncbi:bacteriophage minor capsid protein C [Ameyamaea chiangmaiensis NBRC 103196]|uniref:S49 family peptidase n=1 Tax=Ameyamaea chiangmaiensis TaxID=442969 RepID=A0A850P9M6_9PROT|nr:S49 family peptidase [Ameyamaea chiangmaiensis]MBS4075462.1 S49 family peptidase [Ameyamaea chiangmaiensis]NVN39006.1 S49 family peptidase [Ameyamaea chiangmaiensis]GBQ69678.1 bacteriophage minor capsid protein C [Ameyamaea chiangmaiensis NBRC 103196]
MSRLPFLAQKIFNVPVAIHPQKAEIIVAALADRLVVAHIVSSGRAVATTMSDDEGDAEPGSAARDVGYDVVAGVAVIPVTGTLVQKLGSIRPFSGMTGYDGIRHNLLCALADDTVRGIMLDIDSPGGEVAGCFDLVDLVFSVRGQKPIRAVLDENAFSAAYALASACDGITVPRTGGTGSIGVICMHADLTRAMDKDGITVTLIRYGDLKAERSPYEALSKGALGRMQADIDTMGELFVDTVARNRGLRASDVRGFQARTFLGAEGVTAGLANAVMSPAQSFADFVGSL